MQDATKLIPRQLSANFQKRTAEAFISLTTNTNVIKENRDDSNDKIGQVMVSGRHDL